MGTQWPSSSQYPKPDVANRFVAEFFPTAPVIDLWYEGAAREWDQ